MPKEEDSNITSIKLKQKMMKLGFLNSPPIKYSETEEDGQIFSGQQSCTFVPIHNHTLIKRESTAHALCQLLTTEDAPVEIFKQPVLCEQVTHAPWSTLRLGTVLKSKKTNDDIITFPSPALCSQLLILMLSEGTVLETNQLRIEQETTQHSKTKIKISIIFNSFFKNHKPKEEKIEALLQELCVHSSPEDTSISISISPPSSDGYEKYTITANYTCSQTNEHSDLEATKATINHKIFEMFKTYYARNMPRLANTALNAMTEYDSQVDIIKEIKFTEFSDLCNDIFQFEVTITFLEENKNNEEIAGKLFELERLKTGLSKCRADKEKVILSVNYEALEEVSPFNKYRISRQAIIPELQALFMYRMFEITLADEASHKIDFVTFKVIPDLQIPTKEQTETANQAGAYLTMPMHTPDSAPFASEDRGSQEGPIAGSGYEATNRGPISGDQENYYFPSSKFSWAQAKNSISTFTNNHNTTASQDNESQGQEEYQPSGYGTH